MVFFTASRLQFFRSCPLCLTQQNIWQVLVSISCIAPRRKKTSTFLWGQSGIIYMCAYIHMHSKVQPCSRYCWQPPDPCVNAPSKHDFAFQALLAQLPTTEMLYPILL